MNVLIVYQCHYPTETVAAVTTWEELGVTCVRLARLEDPLNGLICVVAV